MKEKLSPVDRLRRWNYLQSVDLWLTGAGNNQRKQILGDLRAKLAEAAPQLGMAGAIDDLGRPRKVARDYLDHAPTPGPTWHLGLLAAVITTGLFAYAVMIYTFGLLDALSAAGAAAARTHFLGLTLDATVSPWYRVEISGFSWVWSVVAGLAFGLFARPWRLLRRGQPSTARV